MAWTYFICRTRDGGRLGWLEPVTGGSWARRLNIASAGTHDFHLGTNPRVWERLRPGRRTLVVCWDDEPVYAGIIWSATYRKATNVVSVSHSDIWSIWERRMAAPHYRAWDNPDELPKETYIRYADRDRRTLAKKIVQLGLIGIDPDAPAYDLPISFSPDATGSWTRTFRAYDWLTVADRLRDLRSYGGPMQIDFRPAWSQGKTLVWELRVTHGDLGSTTRVLHVDAPQSHVLDFSIEHNMEEYASEYHVVGSGQEVEAIHRWWSSSYLSDDQVALARVFNDGTLDDGDDVADYRDGLVDRHTTADVQFGATYSITSGGYTPLDFTLGHRIIIRADSDPILGAGDHEFMLIGFSPNGPHSIQLELSPSDGFTGHGMGTPTQHYRNLRAGQFSDVTQRLSRAERRIVFGGE